MTCTVCGATLESTADTCPVCAAPLAPGGTPSGHEPAGSGAVPPGGGGQAGSGPTGATGTGGAPPPGGEPPLGGVPPQGGVPPHGGGPSQAGVPPYVAQPAWGPSRPHPSGLSSEVRGWGIGAHLAGLVLGLASAAMLAFLGPLVVWLLKKDDHPFVDHHAKEALNFQLTVLLVIVGSVLLTVPVVIIGVLTLGLALIPIVLLVIAAVIAWVALPIIAAVKASNGEGYRYPVTIRFVR
jgi:uncharacterized protein